MSVDNLFKLANQAVNPQIQKTLDTIQKGLNLLKVKQNNSLFDPKNKIKVIDALFVKLNILIARSQTSYHDKISYTQSCNKIITDIQRLLYDFSENGIHPDYNVYLKYSLLLQDLQKQI